MTLDADGFTGSILAVEGIKDAMVVLNGPTGCKFYHSHLSDCQYPRATSFDPFTFREEFYFGQPRVPCTYLEGEDYVAGSTTKLTRILPVIAEKTDALIVIINSPGASLIGDDLNRFLTEAGLEKRCLAIENAGYSVPVSQGFEHTFIQILKWMGLEKKESVPSKINLIGLGLYQSNWDSCLNELRRLLSFMGVEIGSVVCGATTREELQNSPDAALNVVVLPEYGLRIADWYEREFGIPFVCSKKGAPVGHYATIEWLEMIASALGLDPSAVINACKKDMRSTLNKISRFNSLTGLPKGATFSIKADSSVALPLIDWLYNYLGMAPAAVETLPGGDPECERRIREMLERIGFADAWNRSVGLETVDVVFSDGHHLHSLKVKKQCRAAIEVSLPSSGYLNFLPRTYMGIHGALFLLEEIFNGLRVMP